jgi:putative oxidoreductase
MEAWEMTMFPQLEPLSDYALVLLRLMVGLVFIDSGYHDLKDPGARGKSIGLPRNLTIFLAAAELSGGVAVVIGFLTQLAAIGLILIMLGAIGKKVFVWKTDSGARMGSGGTTSRF